MKRPPEHYNPEPMFGLRTTRGWDVETRTIERHQRTRAARDHVVDTFEATRRFQRFMRNTPIDGWGYP